MSTSLLSILQTWERLAWGKIETIGDVDQLCSTTDAMVKWCDANNASFLSQPIDDFKEAFLHYHRDGGANRIQETRARATSAIRRLKNIIGKHTPIASPGDFLSAKDIAKMVNVACSPVETFLRRFRKARRDCFIITDSRRRNEPKYLYRLPDVLPALKEHFQLNLSDG